MIKAQSYLQKDFFYSLNIILLETVSSCTIFLSI